MRKIVAEGVGNLRGDPRKNVGKLLTPLCSVSGWSNATCSAVFRGCEGSDTVNRKGPQGMTNVQCQRTKEGPRFNSRTRVFDCEWRG
jgi:hypothetical protein